MKITIGWLYADYLNIYGDRGNMIALRKRLEWRGFEVTELAVGKGPAPALDECDIVFVGGGQDHEQARIHADVVETKRDQLRRLVEEDLVVLGVCAGFQLLGNAYVTASEAVLPGVGILDVTTRSGPMRFVGDVIVDATLPELAGTTIVGFENHGGRTLLGDVAPLGRVRRGFGNNGSDRTEGATRRNVFGTYLHGALLPRNPHFADLLIARALARRGLVAPAPLDDRVERAAHAYVTSERTRHRRRANAPLAGG